MWSPRKPKGTDRGNPSRKRVPTLEALEARSLLSATIGFWDASHGGISSPDSWFGGGEIRSLIDANFPGTTIVTSPTLTPTFLGSVNAVVLTSAFDEGGTSVSALSSAEQQALLAFVNAGGGALLVTENSDYQASSNSLVAPFGLDTTGQLVIDPVATVVNRTSFPTVTNGPFGVVSTVDGNYPGGTTT